MYKGVEWKFSFWLSTNDNKANKNVIFLCNLKKENVVYLTDLGAPFFPGGPELWHHPLAYSAATGDLPGAAALQHATLVHPALHPQVPVRSYL